jgi:REP-associated tyrosine transposase
MVYIDLKVVRTGIVSHPGEWIDSGYVEIQSPRRKCILIDYKSLGYQAGFEKYEDFQKAHREWVNRSLLDEELVRQPTWTESIASGSELYVENTQKQMGAIAIGHRVLNAARGCELREKQLQYNVLSDAKKRIIDQNNLFQ